MRKLNMDFAKGMAAIGATAAVAYAYEEYIAKAVVNTAYSSGNLNAGEIVAELAVGWLPFIAATYYGNDYANSFAGAVMYNRIDHLVKALQSMRAQAA